MANYRIPINADTNRGKRLCEIVKNISGGADNPTARSAFLGIEQSKYRRYELGANIPDEALVEIMNKGGDISYILTGNRTEKDEKRELSVLHVDAKEIPVIGHVAADDTEFKCVSFMQEVDGKLQLSENLSAVRVVGDSMSPFVSDGQYILIDSEDSDPPRGSVVVAEILERDGIYLDEPEYYCKRVQIADGTAVFSSINIMSGSPGFSCKINCCRMWPVRGVWIGNNSFIPID